MASGRWRLRVPFQGRHVTYGVYDTEELALMAQGRWGNTHLLPVDDPAADEPLPVTARPQRPLRCGEVFEQWQEAKKGRRSLVTTARRRGGSETTAQRDRDQWRAWWDTAIGDLLPATVMSEDIIGVIDALQSKGRSPNYVRTHWAMVAAFFNWMAEEDIITASPIKGQSIRVDPAEDRVRDIVVPDFVFIDMLSKRFQDQDRLIFELLLGTGGRRSEVVGIKVGDVDLPANRVWIREPVVEPGGQQIRRPKPKGGHYRSVVLGPDLAVLVKEQLLRRGMPGADEPLIVSPRGDLLRWSNYIPEVFRPAVEATAIRWAVVERRRLVVDEGFSKTAARLRAVAEAEKLKKLAPHHLRHTAAAMMWAAGASDIEIQLTLGHSNLETSRKLYAHILKGSQETTAAKVEQMRKARA